jgi:D-alanyl-D-alanine carboxypeptidase
MLPATTPALRSLHEQLGVPTDFFRDRPLLPVAEAAPDELRVISAAPREIKLVAPAAEAWSSLRDAALRDGLVLVPVSGFRSIEYQAELFRRKLAAGQSIEQILAVNAPPGFSEHHSGRALDIGTRDSPPLEEAFADTNAFGWLTLNAKAFGFRMSYPRGNPMGFVFEPWHWCWSAMV